MRLKVPFCLTIYIITCLKKCLSILRSVEVVVLNCKKLEKEKEKLAALEKQHGVTGFAELQSRLEEVSGNSSLFLDARTPANSLDITRFFKGQKQKKDQEKGQTMEDISRMVTELNSKIEAKREIIEPLLNRVR